MVYIEQVRPIAAKAAMDKDPDAVYLGVRSQREFTHGHLAGAIDVPVVFFDASAGATRNREFLAVVEKVLSRDRTISCG